MVAVNISDFKAHLAQYLRQVRNGVELEVLDRTTPVARLVPVIKETQAKIIPPKKNPKGIQSLKAPSDMHFKGDVMDILNEERQRR